METIISELNIDQVLSSSKVVMVDFWAPWCGPCRILSPTVDEIATEFTGRATVAQCNVDDCEDISIKYGIRNIPALLFFKDGQLVDRMVGAQPKSNIVSKLENLINQQ